MSKFNLCIVLGFCLSLIYACQRSGDAQSPNIILIYADDLGYGDLSSYGAKKVQTPHIDSIGEDGIRFVNAYATSATCTPSRYSMLQGIYAWRKTNTRIAKGDAQLILDPNRMTLPGVLQKAGYTTSVVGKWHLGLDDEIPNWNGEIKPGPLECGFDYSFLIPATGDRVPCVYVENHHVYNYDPSAPIEVDFKKPFPGEPIGLTHPEKLKVQADEQHSKAIVNGISRIGYMKGGGKALWVDEDMADVITEKAVDFIERSKDKPFFLFFSLHDIHVPRVPHPRFVGATDMGPRGDVIVQTDWCVGEILKALDRLNIAEDTIVMFSSDNGPIWDDGYVDDAFEKLGDHKAAGPLRGSKYTAFEGGARVPLLLRWPKGAKKGESKALISQIDFAASFAKLTGVKLEDDELPDSVDTLSALLGHHNQGRKYIVQEGKRGNQLSLRYGDWKYIEPAKGLAWHPRKKMETSNSPDPRLFDLSKDMGEKNNLIDASLEKSQNMKKKLEKVKSVSSDRTLHPKL